ncbi:hypothetical protein Y032_0141g2236 [Ancylostoma ceylanicum]|uniref:Uncharacterized protein n=1 Tax=Ancylostoma ceylanicum TaxID=53326 RepID=A0A016T2Z2_9BILA|nr:hypothetical protein Y032_0141g2236 [Ancylostoma ceylanicum]
MNDVFLKCSWVIVEFTASIIFALSSKLLGRRDCFEELFAFIGVLMTCEQFCGRLSMAVLLENVREVSLFDICRNRRWRKAAIRIYSAYN